jgi:hypothetical protein
VYAEGEGPPWPIFGVRPKGPEFVHQFLTAKRSGHNRLLFGRPRVGLQQEVRISIEQQGLNERGLACFWTLGTLGEKAQGNIDRVLQDRGQGSTRTLHRVTHFLSALMIFPLVRFSGRTYFLTCPTRMRTRIPWRRRVGGTSAQHTSADEKA